MGQYKKLSYNFVIVIICVCTFFTGYSKGCSFVFADDTTDSWLQVTTNQQLVEAFKYYCKSRDVTIEGSVADGVTSFTTKTFNGLVNSLGIDVNTLQANLKYQTDGNIGTRFLFNTLSIDAYNRIFAQFLQDNELAVGDNVNNKSLFNGKYSQDSDLLIWTISENTGMFVDYPSAKIIQRGSIIADSYTLKSMYDNGYDRYTFPLDLKTITLGMTEQSNGNAYYTSTYGAINQVYYYSYNPNWDYKETMSGTVFLYFPYDNSYNTGTYAIRQDTQGNVYENICAQGGAISFPQDKQPININIYMTTNNNVINNNNYEGDTIINNNGTTSDGGGGGGTPPDPDPENPILPDPDYTPAEDWDIDLPDLQIPNWILSGKENKFPFDIPFNVMYALTLLQAEPEAPHLEGTLDFGFTTWDYDLDLSEFDSVALICRNMEFLAFLTGLMLMTRRLIWG